MITWTIRFGKAARPDLWGAHDRKGCVYSTYEHTSWRQRAMPPPAFWSAPRWNATYTEPVMDRNRCRCTKMPETVHPNVSANRTAWCWSKAISSMGLNFPSEKTGHGYKPIFLPPLTIIPDICLHPDFMIIRKRRLSKTPFIRPFPAMGYLMRKR